MNVDSREKGNPLQPRDDVHEVKDETGSVPVACTDWMLKRLERKSTTVKRRLCPGMRDLLFSVEWRVDRILNAVAMDSTRTLCSPTTRLSADRGRQRAQRV